MSVTLWTPDQVDPSPIVGLSFFDDFIGAAYDSDVWTLNGVTVSSPNSLSGRVLVSNSGNGEFRWSNLGVFSAAKNARVKWHGALIQSTGTAECGFDGAGNQNTDWFNWIASGGFFQCTTASGGSTSTVSSGVASDSNDHDFEIVLTTGVAQFFLDGVLRRTSTLFVSASAMQPYLWVVGAGTCNMDYVLAQGDR